MYLTYLRQELRRRARQAMVIALGLAIGIALVVTVSAASAGVNNAQNSVLHSLYGVGTDMTVTKTASAGSGGPQHFGFGGGSGGSTAKRPAVGTHVSRNSLRSAAGDSTFSSGDVSKIASLKGTSAATGGLLLTDTSFSGKFPSSSSSGSGSSGGGSHGGSGGGSTSSSASNSKSSFNISSFTVDGVQISNSGVGPLSASQVSRGRYFTRSENKADVAIVGASYAKQHSLSVGSKLTVAGKKLSVIGIASASASSADVYIPLGTAQTLSGLKGDVNTVFVSATSATNVSALASSVKKTLPGTTVSTSASLAKEVSGSLSSASSLATNLGVWLSILALFVAFTLAGLLMMSSVSRRVREFGTLKAIGWRTRRIVGQVMGEGVAIGIFGAIGGVILGIVGAEIITAISPELKATVGSGTTGGTGAAGGAGGVGGFGHTSGGGVHTVLVHLTAPLQDSTIALAIGLAVAGGLIAASFGAWRAARLRPAAALRTIA
jgi:putative ABC transport system permease protein